MQCWLFSLQTINDFDFNLQDKNLLEFDSKDYFIFSAIC